MWLAGWAGVSHSQRQMCELGSCEKLRALLSAEAMRRRVAG